MPDPGIKEKDIFKESNMLHLTKSLFFQDTTRIEGSYFTPSIRKGERRFFGYVYMCVIDKDVPYLFENGISPIMCNIESGEYPLFGGVSVSGKTYGFALTNLSIPANLRKVPCLVTYTCFRQACRSYPAYSVCLIDIRELGGIFHSEPWNERYSGTIGQRNNIYAFTREVFDIAIAYPVSRSRVVGVIKPLPLLSSSLHAQRLKLYVNPKYAGGMKGARAVVASFNGESEWVMVDA